MTFTGVDVHEVRVASSEDGGKTFLTSRCWASQKKNVKYEQQVMVESTNDRFLDVTFATCHGCPAGADGGLCQHVFTLLLVVERCCWEGKGPLPGKSSVTSMLCSWGPQQRDVEPHPIMQTLVERAKADEERKRKLVSCTLYEARGPSLRETDEAEMESLRSDLPADARMKSLLPAAFKTISTAWGIVPFGNLASYQLKTALPLVPVLHKKGKVSLQQDAGHGCVVGDIFSSIAVEAPQICAAEEEPCSVASDFGCCSEHGAKHQRANEER